MNKDDVELQQIIEEIKNMDMTGDKQVIKNKLEQIKNRILSTLKP